MSKPRWRYDWIAGGWWNRTSSTHQFVWLDFDSQEWMFVRCPVLRSPVTSMLRFPPVHP